MCRTRFAALFVLVFFLIVGFAVTEQATHAQNAPDKYKVSITVTVADPNGPPRVMVMPAATIPQGDAQTLKFEVGNERFHFDVSVKPNPAQKLVAKTTGRLNINGKQQATPTIEQPVGTPAEIKVAGIAVKVSYTPVN